MFTQPAPTPTSPGLGTPVVESSTTSNSTASGSAGAGTPIPKTSRLRRLSYLRNYTQTHLLSREHSNGNNHHQSLSQTQTQNHSNHGSGTTSPTSGTSSSNNNAHTNNTLTTIISSALSSNHLLHPSSTSPSLESPNPLARSTTHPPAAASTSQGQTSAAAAAAEPLSSISPSSNSSPSRPTRFALVPTLTNPLGAPSLNAPQPSPRPQETTATSIVFGRRSAESAAIPTVVTTAAASGTIENPVPAQTDDSTMTRARSATAGDAMAANNNSSSVDVLPSIRFSTFVDPRAPQPSLTFPPVSRTLPTGNEIIRVGRYSERDSQPNIPHNVPSAAPVGFKSKVVSRRHCEFWYKDGKWYIKDVKSSSGTFLNHIRLSPAGSESKPFPVNDGDIVQLGIDFKGGEEMIFRCVKMRLELNRGWQSKLNTFNMTTHKRLRNMTASSGNSSSYSQDCSICLNRIAPCQSLFVAPCSHTWHYKCIRSLLSSASYPIFICPNCRAAADLEADVEEPEEEWEQLDSDEGNNAQQEGALVKDANGAASLPPPRKSRESVRSARQALLAAAQQAEPEDVTMLDPPPPTPPSQPEQPLPIRPLISHTASNPMPIPLTGGGASIGQRAASASAVNMSTNAGGAARTPSPGDGIPTVNGHEGPITPRNDAGPWVFDGSAIRLRSDGVPVEGGGGGGVTRINSLEAAVVGGGNGAGAADGEL